MSRERFDELNEALLRAGVAPRHVRRYVTELRDHFEDLVREEMESGSALNEAETAARGRIGSDDELARIMLARPELRSITARFPWATFGVGPILMLVLIVAAALLIQGVLILWSPPMPRWSVPWGRLLFDILNWLTTYAAPLAIAAILCVIGMRQRMAPGWIVLGIAIIGVVGGFHEIGVAWSDTPTEPNQLSLGFALWPPYPRNMIFAGVLRAAINLALVAVGYWLWSHRSWERATVTDRG